MKAYLITTGTLFVVLTVAHIARVTQEQHLARDPWFLLTTVLSIVMAGWAFGLLRARRQMTN